MNASTQPPSVRSGATTTLFHIAQHKAGSQWLHHILLKCVPDRVVTPRIGAAHFLQDRLVPGLVYPTVYVTREQFESIPKPLGSRHFVVLRDLRDILVSAYFSIRYSHPEVGNLSETKQALAERNTEEGYFWLLDRWLTHSATIGRSWGQSGEPWLRYEDLLQNDLPLLEREVIDRCGLEVDRSVFRRAVMECRFENLSKGRARGSENVHSHFRKGVTGDWRNHFTPNVKRAFKERYNDVLQACGYVHDNNW